MKDAYDNVKTHASPIFLLDNPSALIFLIFSNISSSHPNPPSISAFLSLLNLAPSSPVKDIELPWTHCKKGGITPVVYDGADGGGE
jgi:hypothetical protein